MDDFTFWCIYFLLGVIVGTKLWAFLMEDVEYLDIPHFVVLFVFWIIWWVVAIFKEIKSIGGRIDEVLNENEEFLNKIRKNPFYKK